MTEHHLRVGAAVLPITPPLGIDMLGFVNRMRAGTGYGEPMEVGAIAVESGGQRIIIVSIDMAVCPLDRAGSCPKHAVLINFNHSHGLPGFPAAVKLGGQYPEYTLKERLFADYVVEMAVSAAELAISRFEDAEMELGVSAVEGLSVNRRERTKDGGTILGWNPDGACDRSVQTVCFKRKDQSVIVTAVNFACHPVVLGKDVSEYSSDFVGPLRKTVKQVLGGECIFLQGAAGNILPLEGFNQSKGMEVEFGTKLAMKAIESVLNPVEPATVMEKFDFASTTPISLYRKKVMKPAFSEAQPVISAAEQWICFPYEKLPARQDLTAEIERREEQLAEMLANPDPLTSPNTVRYHIAWAKEIVRTVDEGSLQADVEAPLQAIRIGNLGICAAPGEIFNEIGLAVKEKSKAKVTFYCGYSNGVLGYFPTAAEYAYGGYEPSVSHRGYGQPSAFDPQCESILVETSTRLLNGLFNE
ncbi:hypothetical protein [Paenibacillus eucommiae]|uniref:Neutral/alkaline non-lysosomal ceramidase N-terminal domain-containing protein n=1 Tax=Paenibacillus eucommiae TaxID=1355755 RepID=A0ABS4IM44_9BACL|nr:hypothetical protein [Paenibacillus eucommiae]MBP1988638.1 hypothetical protein [Paenibacillus eucommiae]